MKTQLTTLVLALGLFAGTPANYVFAQKTDKISDDNTRQDKTKQDNPDQHKMGPGKMGANEMGSGSIAPGTMNKKKHHKSKQSGDGKMKGKMSGDK